MAEVRDALVGYAELNAVQDSPIHDVYGWELVRLYVQPGAQRSGIGSALLESAENVVRESGACDLWLTVWEGNVRALAFYAAMGYAERGDIAHKIEGREYGNRVLAKRLHAA